MNGLKSVRLQLTILYIGSITLVIVIFGTVVFFSLQTILLEHVDSILYNGAKGLEFALSEYARKQHGILSGSDDFEELWADEMDVEVQEIFFDHITYVQLLEFPDSFGPAPRVIDKTSTLKGQIFKALPISQRAYYAMKDERHLTETVKGIFQFPLRLLSLQIQSPDGKAYVLQIALSLHEMQNTLDDLLHIFLVSFPAFLILVTGLGYVFMKRAFSPIKRMVAVARSITAEDLSLRLKSIESHDEIGELAETLNAMIARLDRSFQQIRQFSGDVSHELKTPLADLKSNAEIMLRKDRSKEEYRNGVASIIDDAQKLQKIIEDLLFLAKIDSQNMGVSMEIVALHEIFLEVFEEIQPLATKKHLALSFTEVDIVSIKGDAGLLKRMLSNLMTNAIYYTPSGGELGFSLHEEHNNGTELATLTIRDTGIGIPPESLPHIFDRFYRVDQARSHQTGGSGLGLAIVKKIIEIHSGKISVQSTVGHGTTFRVSFPCLS